MSTIGSAPGHSPPVRSAVIAIAHFGLNNIDEHLLKQIVQKFTLPSGIAFYRSCRGARELVEWVKPAWPFPNSWLLYIKATASICGSISRTRTFGIFRMRNLDVNIPAEFCRIETVEMEHCEDHFFHNSVLPELSAIGGVGKLLIRVDMSEERLLLLLAASKPSRVILDDRNCDVTSSTYKSLRDLEILVVREDSYWMTKRIFELAKDRKTIALNVYGSITKMTSITEIVTSFLENWMKGESTDSLEKLTVRQACREVICGKKKREEMLADFQNLVNRITSTPQGCIRERGGLGRLRIRTAVSDDFLKIDFHFL